MKIGFEHIYDRAGNKLTQRSLHDPLDSQRYACDSANRLTAFSRGHFTRTGDAFCESPTSPTWSGMGQGRALRSRRGGQPASARSVVVEGCLRLRRRDASATMLSASMPHSAFKSSCEP